MNRITKHYLYRSLRCLENWLPIKTEDLLGWYENHPHTVIVETEENDLTYCLFSLPCLSPSGDKICRPEDLSDNTPERIILLVFDRETAIADISALHTSMQDFLFNSSVFSYISEESDWNYLSHYCLCRTYFSSLPYPAVDLISHDSIAGEALLITNAYVTTIYRRHSIFTNMIRMIKEHALRYVYENTDLYSVISLDPDIAQYGPDTVPEPYHYTFEADEPKRLINAEIMRKLNFTPIQLEQDDAECSDGAKSWFALQHEKELFSRIKLS